MRAQRVAQLVLGAAAWLWVAAIVFVPAAVFPVGAFICHQRPDRSFFYHGHQLAVCARCTGMYLGAAAAVPLALVLAVPLSGSRARTLLACAALPTAVTWTLEYAGLLPFSNLARCLAALPLGAAAAWLVFSGIGLRSSGHPPSPIVLGDRPSVIGHRSSAIGHRPSVVGQPRAGHPKVE